jgi:lysozyme family protein
MSAGGFERSLPFVLRWEGGFVDNPRDRGGRTNRGITQKVYDSWRQQQGASPRDVQLLEDAEMRAIYQAQYWLPPRCDLLESALDLVQIDTAVNMGPGRAVQFLQSAMGCGVDGQFGPTTQKAIQECDLGATTAACCDAREQYYRALVARDPTQAIFLRGWMNRLNALRVEAGLPGYEAAVSVDFGDTGFIAKVPDVGEDAKYDFH